MTVVPQPLDLNGSWLFRFEEGARIADAANPDFTPERTMPVPACFDTMPDFYLRRGVGLYRRTFHLDRDVPAAWLVVEGMGLVGSFAIDGRPIATSALPYSTLRLPTGPLAAGRHTVSAAIGNRFDEPLLTLARPYYDFYLYGGFYHGVSLEFDDRRLRVRTRDYRDGTVEIEAAGFAAGDFDAALLFDGENEVAATFRGGRATVKVPDFKLWSPDEPNLHTVELEELPAERRGSAATRHSSRVTRHCRGVSARFGIRAVEAREGRIWLNGKPVWLKGANRHDAHPTFGAATPDALMALDIQNLKALGCNFVRGAHYPQSRRFLDLCDENGLLVWEESLGWGNGQSYTDREGGEFADARFAADQLAQTRLMVEKSFNHPSVIIFAFMNEFNSALPAGRAIAESLADAIRSYDAGRLVTFACNCSSTDICNDLTDIVSFNTYPGWIGSQPGDGANLKRLMAENIADIVARHRAKWGGKPIIVSEMGACGEYGRHDAAAAQWTEEFEAEYLADAIGAAAANPEIAGFTIWQLTDCRSYHRGGADIRCKPFAENLAGVFDGYRRPKIPVAAAVTRTFADVGA